MKNPSAVNLFCDIIFKAFDRKFVGLYIVKG